MGNTKTKNEEKAPLGENRKGRGYLSGNMVRRYTFVGTTDALNYLHVKLDYW